MPEFTASIDPVTRIEGHMKVDVRIDKVDGRNVVVEARSVGTLFRGFEQLLTGRDPYDAPHITERICGICPVAHGAAAVLALEAAAGVVPPANGRVLRNLVMGANLIDSHVLHFYLLALPDFIRMPEKSPWGPAFGGDRRLDPAEEKRLLANYVRAMDMRRKAHEAGALFGGRMPHPPAFMPGGMTTTPRPERIEAFRKHLDELLPFLEDTLVADTETVAKAYPDYDKIGEGPGNLLAFGAFRLDDAGKLFFPRGRCAAGDAKPQSVDLGAIREDVHRAWYEASGAGHPATSSTKPQYPKQDAYSWVKAPRYGGKAYECGPLARLRMAGLFDAKPSVIGRLRARAAESLHLARAMRGWLAELDPAKPHLADVTLPENAEACGLTEAPRGALGHWLRLEGGKIAHYQVLTPTCWNASPRDKEGVAGPLELALVGTPVADEKAAIEVLRVIHSIDPCMDCAVHVAHPGPDQKVFAVGHYHAGDETPHPHVHTNEQPGHKPRHDG